MKNYIKLILSLAFTGVKLGLSKLEDLSIRSYSFAVGREFPPLLWNSKVYFPIHKTRLMNSIVSQFNSVRSIIYLGSISVSASHIF
jgi:hypothetical protein